MGFPIWLSCVYVLQVLYVFHAALRESSMLICQFSGTEVLSHCVPHRREEWEILHKHTQSMQRAQLFVLGDFNSILLPARDVADPAASESKEVLQACTIE